jgi:saccharopine dehydrogenase-like NADP-dependent oxidoreductase
LVLGGSGNFGARITRALQGDATIELLVAGRRTARIPGAEAVPSIAVDIDSPNLADQLAAAAPGLVIHCVGPFQGQDYRVVQAALLSGAHYLDLADGRDFVTGFSTSYDAIARNVNRLAITGASTLPAISSAVIDTLRESFSRIERIEVAIAPGQRAPRGVATLEAVFSYLGRPFSVWRRGRWRQVWGWMDLRRLRFDAGTRWAAACDVPDLALFPERYPGSRSVEFHAALEFGIQHFALWLLAAVRRIGLPVNVGSWAVRLNGAAAMFDRWAEDWGGMRVHVDGVAYDGRQSRRTWQLSAPALHGPEIPCIPAILLARRIARGDVAERGAYPCMGFLTLAEFEAEFARWDIRTRIEDESG